MGIIDTAKGFPTWVADQFQKNLWYMLVWSAACYFTGAFTAPMIPKVNKVIVQIATKFGA